MSDVETSQEPVRRGPRKIVIDPVTRVEGHGKVTIRLNEAGEVGQARFHIVEFRGFERFIRGRLYWEVPVIVQRLAASAR
jgi:NAD-reducing hydrogenase large subunit